MLHPKRELHSRLLEGLENIKAEAYYLRYLFKAWSFKSFHSFYFDVLFQLLPSVCAYSCISMFRLCELQSGNSCTFCFSSGASDPQRKKQNAFFSYSQSCHTPRAYFQNYTRSRRATLFSQWKYIRPDTSKNFLSPPS